MSYRSTKRRRLDIEGKRVQTQQDTLINTLQSKDINSHSLEKGGYFLRSSTRKSKKRKFVPPSTIKEVETGEIGETDKENKKENVDEPPLKKQKINNGKLSKIKHSIASAFNKMTTTKITTKITTKTTKIIKKQKDEKVDLEKQEKQRQKKEKLKKQQENASNKEKYEYDDKGYIIFHKKLVMNNRYCVQRRLGKGTFSKVFACSDLKDDKYPNKAIKVIRNQHKYQIAARTELRILDYLKANDLSDKYHVIKLIESSYFQMHPIFVFPLYGRSLYHYLYDNNFRPFPDSHIKTISKQVIEAVSYVHSLGIIITDLKPENIIICNDTSDRHLLGDNSIYYTLKSTKIRLIDFGSAVFNGPSNTVHTHLIQTRHYRAPEVMFKFNWSYSADIWSIGCVIVELANGKMLFNTHDTIDHLNQIITAIGPIPAQIIQLIDENVYNELFHFDAKLALHRAKISNVQCSKLKSYFHSKYHKNIYDLVKLMLSWNPQTRINAQKSLQHPLFV